MIFFEFLHILSLFFITTKYLLSLSVCLFHYVLLLSVIRQDKTCFNYGSGPALIQWKYIKVKETLKNSLQKCHFLILWTFTKTFIPENSLLRLLRQLYCLFTKLLENFIKVINDLIFLRKIYLQISQKQLMHKINKTYFSHRWLYGFLAVFKDNVLEYYQIKYHNKNLFIYLNFGV